jgi:hypothetical protein
MTEKNKNTVEADNEAAEAKLASMRDSIIDTLAQRVAAKNRLPTEIVVAGLSMSTAAFLSGFRFDTRPASVALQRIAPAVIVGAAQTNECASQIIFYLADQMQKAADHKARLAAQAGLAA